MPKIHTPPHAQPGNHHKYHGNTKQKHYEGQVKHQKHQASTHKGSAAKHQRSAARNAKRSEEAHQNQSTRDSSISDDWEPSSWFGNMVVGVLSIAAVPVTVGLQLATNHPFMAAGIILGSSVVGAMAAPIKAADDVRITASRIPPNATEQTTQEHKGSEQPLVRVKRMYGNTTLHNNQNKDDVGFSATLYNNEEPFCSATVLDHNTLLTAAHCVYEKDIKNLTVGVGSATFSEQTKIPVRKTITHPNYTIPENTEFVNYDYTNSTDDYDYDNNTNYDNITVTDDEYNPNRVFDLGIIKVKNGKLRDLDIPFVPLPKSGVIKQFKDVCDNPKQRDRMRLWAAGSGTTKNFNTTTDKDTGKPTSDFKPPTEVRSGFLHLSEKCIDNETIYIEFEDGVSQDSTICTGDSGSGIFKEHPKTKKLVLVGVARSSDALAGACVHGIKIEGKDKIEAQATLLSDEIVEFMKPHMTQHKGLKRWNGKPVTSPKRKAKINFK